MRGRVTVRAEGARKSGGVQCMVASANFLVGSKRYPATRVETFCVKNSE